MLFCLWKFLFGFALEHLGLFAGWGNDFERFAMDRGTGSQLADSCLDFSGFGNRAVIVDFDDMRSAAMVGGETIRVHYRLLRAW